MPFPFERVTLLDGATGTHMMAAGMPRGACVEQWILDHAAVLHDLQTAYALAGSDIVYAPTFEANRVGLGRHGLAGRLPEINLQLVALTRQAVADRPGRPVTVAASVTTTGLFCEPFGETAFEELIDIYTEQLGVLKAAGLPLAVGETLMTLADARAILLAAGRVGLPAAVTVTVDENGRTLSGLSLPVALVVLQAMGAVAVGLNCSTGPAAMADRLREAAPYAAVPLIAKPNAGLPGQEVSAEAFCQSSRALLDAGAGIVGGCCGTGPEHIAALRRLIGSERPLPARQESLPRVAATGTALFPLEEIPRLSDPLPVDDDLCDALLDADPDDCDALLVRVETPDEGRRLGMEAASAPLPLAVQAKDPAVLEAALCHIQGRALALGTEDPAFAAVAARYGAIPV